MTMMPEVGQAVYAIAEQNIFVRSGNATFRSVLRGFFISGDSKTIAMWMDEVPMVIRFHKREDVFDSYEEANDEIDLRKAAEVA